MPHSWIAFAAIVAAASIAATFVLFSTARMFDAQAEERAAEEATSYADLSGTLATGDAFAGYIQMLRAADDPEVSTAVLPSDQRTAALRRLLELNTNRFSGYAVVDLNGEVLAATDLTMVDAPASEAYNTVRASQGNANSDMVFGEGIDPYVDYGTILIDPAAGAWAVLVARAKVDRLWQPTLTASVDSGQNVIISRDGLMATSIPEAEVGTPWRGSSFAGDTIRTDAVGTDSVCGLHAVAAETKIDHGWNVASCLPASIVLGGGASMLKLGMIAVVGVAVASLLGGVFVWLFVRGGADAVDLAGLRSMRQVETPPAADPEPVVITVTNVEARTVIEAYEARSARVAARIRESVQARLLVVSSRVEEALEQFEEDPELSRAMLQRAAHELDDLNEHELRSLGQELYPDLVRLGLPAALRALKKDIADILDVEVDADADADSLDEESDRAIDSSRRLVLYRAALESLHAFADAGLEACTVTLRSGPEGVWLAVKGHGHRGEPLSGLDADVVAVETYGGTFTVDNAEDATEVVAELAPSDRPRRAAAGDDVSPDPDGQPAEAPTELVEGEPEAA